VRGTEDRAQILAHLDLLADKQLAAVKALRADLAKELAQDFLDALNGQVDEATSLALKDAMEVALEQVVGTSDL